MPLINLGAHQSQLPIMLRLARKICEIYHRSHPRDCLWKRSITSMENFKLEGLIAAPVTPFHDNGELNLDAIAKYIDLLLEQGIKQVYLHGFTGEGPTMTVNERKQSAEKWVKESHGRLEKIVVQIGGTNLKDSQELAVHAQSIRADAIASLPPLFYPCNIASLVEYCRELTTVVPDMPFIYYHIPEFTHVRVKVEDLLLAVKDKVPSFVGVKFTHNDFFDMSQCLMVADGKFQISPGHDEGLLTAFTLGVTSAIGSSFNCSGKLTNAVIEAFKKGNVKEAQKLQCKAQHFLKIQTKYGTAPVVLKVILGFCGLNTGSPRLPLIALSQEKVEALKKDLTDAGFFE